MTYNSCFAYEDKNYFTNQTAYIMVGANLKYLLGVLSSNLSNWYMLNTAYSLSKRAKRWVKQYVERIPIPAITSANKGIVDKIVDLVDRIIQLKNQDINNDISNLEREINELVYKLYDLTQDEIKIIEKSK